VELRIFPERRDNNFQFFKPYNFVNIPVGDFPENVDAVVEHGWEAGGLLAHHQPYAHDHGHPEGWRAAEASAHGFGRARQLPLDVLLQAHDALRSDVRVHKLRGLK
jgi:hypothetical protein